MSVGIVERGGYLELVIAPFGVGGVVGGVGGLCPEGLILGSPVPIGI